MAGLATLVKNLSEVILTPVNSFSPVLLKPAIKILGFWLFLTSINDTGENVIVGVVDTGDKLFTGVEDNANKFFNGDKLS